MRLGVRGSPGWGRKGKSAGHAASLSAIHSRVWTRGGGEVCRLTGAGCKHLRNTCDNDD